ncbi:uncharacterized protein LOC131214334 [Anopheles bellator]|uniref:uncharacterized protein LOC131214333 n=1 Tax=Anopheles bellator TaxID=139047 RepID=UPI002647E44B|nr:uncharacterized protein LOC131214333 [Anopheles bellator]XP_058064699.1 uncharacterized protein LOC131214334 [Anopheles bellator]
MFSEMYRTYYRLCQLFAQETRSFAYIGTNLPVITPRLEWIMSVFETTDLVDIVKVLDDLELRAIGAATARERLVIIECYAISFTNIEPTMKRGTNSLNGGKSKPTSASAQKIEG